MGDYDDLDVADGLQPPDDLARWLQGILITVAACLVVLGTVVAFG